MSNTDKDKYHVQEKQPEPISGKDKEKQGDQQPKSEQMTVDLSAYVEPHGEEPGVRTFAIEGDHRNTGDNPFREATSTLPTLVRRVDSYEVMPKPFKTTNQLLCCSFLSIFCCVCCAAFAISNAFEAKEKRNAGNYTTAIFKGKRARAWIIAALIAGAIVYIINGSLAAAGTFNKD